jgi:hypothetical protein
MQLAGNGVGAQELALHEDLDWINERRKKDKGGKRSLQPQKIGNLESMVWTRGRALPQGKTMQIVVAQLGLYVTATGTTSYIYVHALS